MESDSRTLRIELEIFFEDDPIAGTIDSIPTSRRRSFLGWVALAQAIEQRVAEARALTPGALRDVQGAAPDGPPAVS